MIKTILLYVLIAFTILNVLAMTIGKRRRRIAQIKLRSKIDSLKIKAANEMKTLHSFKGLVYPYVNDNGDCILLCVDQPKNLMSVVTEEGFHAMAITAKKTCDIVVAPESGSRINTVKCIVTSEDIDERITLFFGLKPHRRKGYIGRHVLEMAEEFKNCCLGGFRQNNI